MTIEDLQNVVSLRAVVGFLGEKDQRGWWNSAFFSRPAGTYLTPLFPRTQFLSQTNGVTLAATLLHDDRIGVGHVFHLFRLPEDLEQSLHRVLADDGACRKLTQQVCSVETALETLRALGMAKVEPAAGPIRVGDLHAIRSLHSWKRVAAIYAQAFSSQQQSFPYFADQK